MATQINPATGQPYQGYVPGGQNTGDKPGDYQSPTGVLSAIGQGLFGGTPSLSVNQQLNAAGYLGQYHAAGQQGYGYQAGQGRGQVRQYGGANIDQSQQAQFRAAQMGLMGQLQTQAAGQGPSLATNMLREQTANNVQQQAGLAAALAAGGGSAGAARYGLANNAANMNQQAAGQAADARIQEQLAARQQLAGLSGQARGQDIGLAEGQAGMQQQANLASMQGYNAQLGQDIYGQNAANQFSSQQLQNQYQFNNTFAAQQQDQENAYRIQLEQANMGHAYNQQGQSDQALGALAGAGAQFVGLTPPKQAKGGIFMKPTMVELGEAGPEAVVPLGHSRLAAALHAHAMSNRANALAGAYGGR